MVLEVVLSISSVVEIREAIVDGTGLVPLHTRATSSSWVQLGEGAPLHWLNIAIGGDEHSRSSSRTVVVSFADV